MCASNGLGNRGNECKIITQDTYQRNLTPGRDAEHQSACCKYLTASAAVMILMCRDGASDNRSASPLISVSVLPNQRGSSLPPIKNSSTARAHWRPSRMAQTTSDWPRRMSPAVKTFSALVR